MRVSRRFLPVSGGLLLTGFMFALPGATLAAGAAQPRPDATKKVWTTEDVMALGTPYREAGAPETSGPTTSEPAANATEVAHIRIPKEQDPQWYGDRMTQLESELTSLEGQIQSLRDFSPANAGAATGLVLDAPCQGVTTDNLIAQLEARREEIVGEMDDLGDTARVNGLPPGVLVEGRGRMATQPSVTAEEQKAALLDQIQQNSDELARTQEVLANMQAQAAAQGITLLQPSPGQGGNMTTDLQQRLGDRVSALQNQIDGVTDDALRAGVQPGQLR